MNRHADGPGVVGPVPSAVGDVLRSVGEPLPAAVRASMEESFAGHLDAISPAPSRGQASSVVSQPGDPSERQADAVAARVVGGGEPPARAARPDFGEVRVHTGPAAAAAARSVDASAYTVGKHVVLAQPLSDSHAGRRLLAHELTHVVQQERAGRDLRVPLARQARDAGPEDDPARQFQLACVIRLGGCNIPGGPITHEDLVRHNASCRSERAYAGPDVFPTNEECRNPPYVPLTFAEKVLVGIFAGVAVTAGVAATIAIGAVAIPVLIAGVELAGAAAAGATAFYFANAIAVNEIGLFAAGVLLSCEGDLLELVRGFREHPAQILQMLAEIYVLHVNISVNSGTPRPAKVKVSILPPAEQTVPGKIRLRSVGAPIFDDEEPLEVPRRASGAARPPDPETPIATTAGAKPPVFGPARPPDGDQDAPTVRAPRTRRGASPGDGKDVVRRPKSMALGPNFTPAQARLLREAREQVRPQGSAIAGLLITDDGRRIPLVSGGGGHWFESHIEGKATARMRAEGIRSATLLVEKEPCQYLRPQQPTRPGTYLPEVSPAREPGA